jgi:hypothetical protein
MSPSDLNPQATWHPGLVYAPRRAPACHCMDHEVMASRDEDGEWTCCSCGRPVTPSVTRLRTVGPVVGDLQLRAA